MRLGIGKALKRALCGLNYAAAVLTRGFFCPCCQKRVSRWKDWSPSYRNVLCPKCSSHPRHRLMALYLKRIAPTFKNSSVLHFAAEKSIRLQIIEVAKEYITADLQPEGRAGEMNRQGFLPNEIEVQADITVLPFPEERFDLIVCSHVLEHVHDDTKALAEIFRVMKWDGWALLQTPFDRCRAISLERPEIDTPELRRKHYQQEDHVRLYGREIYTRFIAAGFLPAIIPPESVCPDPKFFGLWPDEDLMIVRKAWTWPSSYFEEESRAIQAARAGAAAPREAPLDGLAQALVS
jgi:SAM-dependent methyltransferase